MEQKHKDKERERKREGKNNYVLETVLECKLPLLLVAPQVLGSTPRGSNFKQVRVKKTPLTLCCTSVCSKIYVACRRFLPAPGQGIRFVFSILFLHT
jgi:hypothetical protein